MISTTEYIKLLGELVDTLQNIVVESNSAKSAKSAGAKMTDRGVTTKKDQSISDVMTKDNLSRSNVMTKNQPDEKPAGVRTPETVKKIEPVTVVVKVDPITFAVWSVESPLKTKSGDNTKTSFALASAIAKLEAQDCGLEYDDVLSDLIDVLSVCSMRGLAKAFPMGLEGFKR